jgi:hypothetical protein
MKTLREAANSLLKKGNITKEEYNLLEKRGALELTKEAVATWKGLKFLNRPSIIKAKRISRDVSEFVKDTWRPAVMTGVAGLVAKEAVVDPLVQASKINKSFETMSEKIPQLQEKDPEKIKDYFNVIKTYSPIAASNPLVAGALVNKMMEFGGVDHKLIQDLSSIQQGVKPGTLAFATETAAKSMSSLPKGV